MKHSNLYWNLAIFLLAALLFVPGLGIVHLFDWDEINFAESAREMLVTGDWFNVQINFESFWEKPPLFIWAQALSMKAFGVNEFAARFPNAVIGILTLLLLFNIGRKAKDTRFGLLWAMMYGISYLPFFYFKSGIIDPWFNFFIFLSIYSFALYTDPALPQQRSRHAALSALFMGLAINTKGPVAFLVFGLTFVVWLIVRRFRLNFRWKDVGIYALVLLLVGGSWFIALALTGHMEVIQDFIAYQIRLFETQDAGHGGFLLYHFLILFFGVVPASYFALGAFRKSILKGEDETHLTVLFRWMMCAFWVVLILFTIVRTKIVHYSSFCYFPLTFLAAYQADRMLDGKEKFHGWQQSLLMGTTVVYGLVFLTLTQIDCIKGALIPYIADPFAVSCLEATSEWNPLAPLVGILLIGATVWFCIVFCKQHRAKDFLILTVANLVFLTTLIFAAVPQVEKYSQASAIEFYEQRKGEDCYVLPTYFKSYAQYFYTDRQPRNRCDDFEWLGKGPIDKPCYFVLKDIPEDVARFQAEVPDARFLYRKSGFRFFKREVPE